MTTLEIGQYYKDEDDGGYTIIQIIEEDEYHYYFDIIEHMANWHYPNRRIPKNGVLSDIWEEDLEKYSGYNSPLWNVINSKS